MWVVAFVHSLSFKVINILFLVRVTNNDHCLGENSVKNLTPVMTPGHNPSGSSQYSKNLKDEAILDFFLSHKCRDLNNFVAVYS